MADETLERMVQILESIAETNADARFTLERMAEAKTDRMRWKLAYRFLSQWQGYKVVRAEDERG